MTCDSRSRRGKYRRLGEVEWEGWYEQHQVDDSKRWYDLHELVIFQTPEAYPGLKERHQGMIWRKIHEVFLSPLKEMASVELENRFDLGR